MFASHAFPLLISELLFCPYLTDDRIETQTWVGRGVGVPRRKAGSSIPKSYVYLNFQLIWESCVYLVTRPCEKHARPSQGHGLKESAKEMKLGETHQ